MNDTDAAVRPLRVDRPVPHSVKFRHATDGTKVCQSEQCPHEDNLIAEGAKYARVARVGKSGATTEMFHPACYDYEFEQGGQ